jgi:hypothetical protein
MADAELPLGPMLVVTSICMVCRQADGKFRSTCSDSMLPFHSKKDMKNLVT